MKATWAEVIVVWVIGLLIGTAFWFVAGQPRL